MRFASLFGSALALAVGTLAIPQAAPPSPPPANPAPAPSPAPAPPAPAAAGSGTTTTAVSVTTSTTTATTSPTASSLCLSTKQVNNIMNPYIAFVQNLTYNGQTPGQIAASIISENYTEYSDSIFSIEKAPLNNTNPAATGRDSILFQETHRPITGITTIQIIHQCNIIVWYWQSTQYGNQKQRVKGFNMLTIIDGQIQTADIEFNSIAWAQDDGQVCPGGTGVCPSCPGTTTTTSSATSTPTS